jgi:hypothetical protein
LLPSESKQKSGLAPGPATLGQEPWLQILTTDINKRGRQKA